MDDSAKWLLILAGLFGLSALGVGCAFFGSGEPRRAVGSIKDKSQVSASTYTQHPVGTDRGFRTPTNIPIAESVVFEIVIEGREEPVRYSTNTVDARQFTVGQNVTIEYVERGIPLIWKRVIVTNMKAIAK